MNNLPAKPKLALGIYKHYKGNIYKVLDLVLHSETLEWHVLYTPLYGSADTIWIRPYKMFIGSMRINGVLVRRFELQEGALAE